MTPMALELVEREHSPDSGGEYGPKICSLRRKKSSIDDPVIEEQITQVWLKSRRVKLPSLQRTKMTVPVYGSS